MEILAYASQTTLNLLDVIYHSALGFITNKYTHHWVIYEGIKKSYLLLSTIRELHYYIYL